jgi:hypothetical protein
MRITYPALEVIRRTEINHQIRSSDNNKADYIGHNRKKDYHYQADLIALYNRNAELKRYYDRTHIDVFI